MGHRASIFITGATGYIGQRLIPALTERGHSVTALVRPGSEKSLRAGCAIVTGDALSGDSYAGHLAGHDALIHLVGVPHPSPARAREFLAVDLKSGEEAIMRSDPAGLPV